jgi:hypothetical protein
MPQKTIPSKKSAARKATAPKSSPKKGPARRARSTTEDVMISGASPSGVAFGRCGGRVLGSRLEQRTCDLLSTQGVTHSHCPRHFEVRFDDQNVAAYAPMIVLRGRGREGKTVVIETAESHEPNSLQKIRAFRRQYGLEFYVCMVAPEDVLDEMPVDAYDEATSTVDLHTLISRLSD